MLTRGLWEVEYLALHTTLLNKVNFTYNVTHGVLQIAQSIKNFKKSTRYAKNHQSAEMLESAQWCVDFS